MFQDLNHRGSFLRIEVKDLSYEVKCIRSDVVEPLFVIFRLDFCENIQHFLAKICFEGLKILNSRRSCPSNNSFDLIKCRIAWKHRLPDD